MQSKCKAMQSNFTRLVFVLILSNYLIINKSVVSFRYAVFINIRIFGRKSITILCLCRILCMQSYEVTLQ